VKLNCRTVQAMACFAFLLITGVVYAGFFFPDPFWRDGRILWGARLGIPALIGAMFFLGHLIRKGAVGAKEVIAVSAAVVIGGLMIYPFASYRYYRSFDLQRKSIRFHPYLQVAPQIEFTPREGDQEHRARIFCLGGSTTAFKDETKANKGWPERVEERLRIRLKSADIDVYNQGTPWYTTLHTLINYETNLRHHRPDVIIVMHAINDLLHNADFCYFSTGKFREDYSHFLGPLSRILKVEGLEASLWRGLRSCWYHRARKIAEQTSFPGLVPFERNLCTLLDLSERDGVKVVLVTQPFLFKRVMNAEEKAVLYMLNVEAVGPDRQWNLETALRGMESYNDTVRRIARERNAILIDLEKIVPKTLNYFKDDVHYRGRAFDLIADHITEELLKSDEFVERVVKKDRLPLR
jgi:hypothetical protein